MKAIWKSEQIDCSGVSVNRYRRRQANGMTEMTTNCCHLLSTT